MADFSGISTHVMCEIIKTKLIKSKKFKIGKEGLGLVLTEGCRKYLKERYKGMSNKIRKKLQNRRLSPLSSIVKYGIRLIHSKISTSGGYGGRNRRSGRNRTSIKKHTGGSPGLLDRSLEVLDTRINSSDIVDSEVINKSLFYGYIEFICEDIIEDEEMVDLEPEEKIKNFFTSNTYIIR